jgi:hypothetical protein
MSPCALFSCSRYSRISGVWLALRGDDTKVRKSSGSRSYGDARALSNFTHFCSSDQPIHLSQLSEALSFLLSSHGDAPSRPGRGLSICGTSVPEIDQKASQIKFGLQGGIDVILEDQSQYQKKS